MSNKTVSVQRKFILPIIVAALIVICISFLVFRSIQRNQINILLETTAGELAVKNQIALDQKSDVWLTNALQMSINTTVIRGMEEKDRAAIQDFIGNISKVFKDNTSFKNVNVHLITRNLISFYKSWAPDKYGESLSYSDVYKYVSQSGKPIVSVEESSKGFRLKGVYPVKKDGKILGMLNFEGGINSMGNSFKKEKIDFLYFLSPQYEKYFSKKMKVKDGYMLSSKSYIDENFLAYVMSDRFSFPRAIKDSYIFDNQYFTVPVVMKDFKGDEIGYALLAYQAQSIKDIIETSSQVIRLSNYFLIGTVLVILLIVYFVLRLYVVKPLTFSIKQLSGASREVTVASNEISSSANGLADMANKQAASIEEINAAIELSLSKMNDATSSSREADQLAKSADNAAEEGNQKVNELMEAMAKISDSSIKIFQIIKAIDEIAFQTNLLALNAAVEAARAGEAGAGFAVVADEVRNLALRAAESAKQTSDIIETSLKDIEAGNDVADQTSKAFGGILDNVKKTSEIIKEITVSMQENTDGMKVISSSIEEIDDAIQQNAATSEEAAATSGELNAQAESMLRSVAGISELIGVRMDDFDKS